MAAVIALQAPVHEYIPKMDARIQASGEARCVYHCVVAIRLFCS
jgi:hypothetical protein